MMLEGSLVTIVALAWLFLRMAQEGRVRQELIEQRRRRADGATSRPLPPLERADLIGSVWGLLLVGLVLASSAMAVLWYVQVRIHDASHVDVAWAVLIACAAILYALLADGDVAHRVLAAVLASVWGFRLGGYLYFNRIRGKEEDGRYQELRAEVGREREPELLRLLPGPGALRRLLLAAVRVHRARSGLELRRRRVDRDRAVGDRERRDDRLGPPARAVARESGEQGEDRARRPVELVAPPELLLRVGELVRERCSSPRRRRWGWIAWLVPAGLLFLLFRVTGIPATEAQALRSRADYAEYQRTTSSFVPLPPRRVTT